MKKCAAVILCLVLLFSLTGCSIAAKNSEAKAALQEVLNHERDFTYKCLVFDKVTEENLRDFHFHTIASAWNGFGPQGYMYIDLDTDGAEELLIVDITLTHFLVLRYDGGQVYGYILSNISTQDVKTDGTFMTIRYNFGDDHKIDGKILTVNRAFFDGLTCKLVEIAYKDEADAVYRINDKSVSEEDIDAYFDSWNTDTTKAEWIMLEYEE